MNTYVLSFASWVLIIGIGIFVGTWHTNEYWCDLVLVSIIFLIRSLSKRFELVLLDTLKTSNGTPSSNWPMLEHTIETLRTCKCLNIMFCKTEDILKIERGNFVAKVVQDKSVCLIAIFSVSTFATLITFLTTSDYIFWLTRLLCGLEWIVASVLLQSQPALCLSSQVKTNANKYLDVHKLWNFTREDTSENACEEYIDTILYLWSLMSSITLFCVMLWGYLTVYTPQNMFHLRAEYSAAFIAIAILQLCMAFWDGGTFVVDNHSKDDSSNISSMHLVGRILFTRSLVHVLMFTTTHIFYIKSDMSKSTLTAISLAAGLLDTILVSKFGYIFYVIDEVTFSKCLYRLVSVVIQSNLVVDTVFQLCFFDHYISIVVYNTTMGYVVSIILIFASASALCVWCLLF